MQLERMFHTMNLASRTNEPFTIETRYRVLCNFVAGVCEVVAPKRRECSL